MPSIPTTYGLSRAYQRLGVKGGQFPGIDDGPAQPVMIVGNVGDTFAAEVIEGRLSFSHQRSIPVGATAQVPEWLISSRGPGGVIVEDLSLRTISQSASTQNIFQPLYISTESTVNVGDWVVRRAIGTPDSIGFNGLDVVSIFPFDIGGIATTSGLLSMTDTTTGPPFALFQFSASDTIVLPRGFVGGPQLRWFIPPGEHIQIANNSSNVSGTGATAGQYGLTFQLREIPEGQGLP